MGDFYIVAVYDDPASCTISFSAYELETDATYTHPLTYSEFDDLFKFDSELMNPSNVDGRFHWVIERLDFIQDGYGQKVLCLANDPTPEGEEDEEEDMQAPKQQGMPQQAASGGKVDAVTRAKLLKELDTHDDAKLHKGLVRSEGARKRFLAKLFAKRQLEQMKAQQRLQKADEEREARLAKLDILKKQQQMKAQQHREHEEATKSTRAQLDVLMKQKEAQAIRRLIQEKDEQDRGMGREKDAARHRRKMQVRSAAEVQAFENQKSQQLARKREDQVVKREKEIKQKDKEIATQVLERMEAERLLQVRRREEKDQIIAERWRLKREEKLERERKHEQFEMMEDKRDSINLKKEQSRALIEKEHWDEMRAVEQEEKEKVDLRRRNLWKDFLLKWKVDAAKRAAKRREDEKRNQQREKKLKEKEDVRLRKFRETQFLDTMRQRTMSPKAGAQEDEDNEESNDVNNASPGSPTGASKADMESWSKSFEQMERQRRHAERLANQKKEEAKRSKVEKLGATNPNAVEVQRIHDWKKAEEKKKQAVEKARTAKALAEEKASRETEQKVEKRAELWETLEARRREASQEREHERNAKVVQRTRNLPIGTGLPMALVY